MTDDDDARLDALLNALPAPRASAGLVERIVASAPQPRRARRRLGWLLPAGLGAGLAAACAAGVVAGIQLSHHAADTESTIAAIAGEDATSAYAEDAA